ncbi:tRNA uridine-5-carboxymethylaminomethyl(34) synthesis GTPase MnmE [Acanthopleuribacter pedis]|uniref:tRNA modification GTPase MnmE n=1 Tax=Acanthopleuribacter pedis TaxID=442870 RepID=A0A8J7Q4V4_9BACT|nr:tRNA uridine-5-carboxymethylaminomethyl(34) synthesis GTPase MnmE [Acanthopleuribacter pedis]MBO1317881.1 tRNA uridine-5-carboxymethylaminomethyl(34) synthesis GTPase MnmE [Acanthopleuribacter pedis]
MGRYSDVDVIVAPATPAQAKSALAIVRVSGEGCLGLVAHCFRPKGKAPLKPWAPRYGDWMDVEGLVDDVMVTTFRGPRSYTGQDMVEISCHGNPVLIQAIQTSLTNLGARQARPGEFTMRAVLNGKMDLLAAEAVNGLIEANTRYQADLIRRQSHGPLVTFINEQVEQMLQMQAHIEATIDYGEEDIDALQREQLAGKLKTMVDAFKRLEQTARFSLAMKRGFKVLLTGEPNVGKSTLFNTLVRHERAIVTELPGTTRDLISEQIEIGGLPIILMDSAGIRDSNDRIEQLGIQKIYELLHDVDLVLFLNDAAEPREPYPQLKELTQEKWFEVVTKQDLVEESHVAEKDDQMKARVPVSALTGKGLRQLEQQIVIRLSTVMAGQSVYLINQRQEEIISTVSTLLKSAADDFDMGFGEEVLSSYLNAARQQLGELTGETDVEDILDRMFSNFCLGK